MTRKPLPKAIRRPVASLRDLGADFVKDEQGRVPRSQPSFDAVEPEPTSSDIPLRHAVPISEPNEKKSSAAAGVSMKGTPYPHAAKRRLLARKIVDRHRLYA